VHNRPLRFPFYNSSLILNPETVSASKKVTVKALQEVNFKIVTMRSYQIHKTEAKKRKEKIKKENAQDTISKSFTHLSVIAGK